VNARKVSVEHDQNARSTGFWLVVASIAGFVAGAIMAWRGL
jgi:hypothetical protein